MADPGPGRGWCSLIQRLEFDSASVDGDEAGTRSARDILVKLSDTGPASGFATIASVSLKPRLDKQSFNVAAAAPGRWLRLTIKNNHGSADYVELFDVRAWGVQKSSTPAASISGTYSTNFDKFHIQQDGAAVTGCYEHANGLIANGGIDGAVTRFTWVQGDKRGPAILAFSPKPDWKFVIEGHTDATATVEHNQALSDKRAVAVKTFLVSAGVAATRLSTRGLGASKPVGDNTTAVGRAQNRRVELVKN